MPQTSATVTAGNDAKASDFDKVVADITEIYAGGPGVPIGGVIHWWSDNTMPANYKECNGQTLSDAASPFNGLVLPNLTNKFIRGIANANVRSTPTTGGEDNHTLTVDEMPGHSHGVGDPGHSHGHSWANGVQPALTVASGTNRTVINGSGQQYSNGDLNINSAGTGIFLGSTGGGAAHNNLPSYVGLVPIIRVK